MSNIKLVSCLFLVLYIFVASTSASVWFNPDAKKTVCNNGKCEDFCETEGQLLKPGTSYKTKFCSEIFCNKDYSTRGVSCGVAVQDGCKMLPDYNLKYPDCCYKICEDDLKQ